MKRKIKNIFQKIWIKVYSFQRKRALINSNFSIISNNCWAGKIYQSYGIKYKTPTVGLFFMSEDFIKFVGNLEFYLNCNLNFISSSESKYVKIFKDNSTKYPDFGTYPIGSLDGIEIHFLHYKNELTAYESWNKRKERINFDNLIIKMNDQNEFLEEHLEIFNNLPFKNKLFFSVNKLPNAVLIKNGLGNVEYLDEPYGKSKVFNVTDFINSIK